MHQAGVFEGSVALHSWTPGAARAGLWRFQVFPLGLPRRIPRAGFDLAHSLRLLAGVPASKWRSFSLQHAAHNLFSRNLTCRASQLGAQAKGPLSAGRRGRRIPGAVGV